MYHILEGKKNQPTKKHPQYPPSQKETVKKKKTNQNPNENLAEITRQYRAEGGKIGDNIPLVRPRLGKKEEIYSKMFLHFDIEF